MTEVTDLFSHAITAIGEGWISRGETTEDGERRACFIRSDGSKQDLKGHVYVDYANNRYAVLERVATHDEWDQIEKLATYVSAPAVEPPQWGWARSSKWSVSGNDVFVAALNDIRRCTDLKRTPYTLYQALVPRQFVKNVFEQKPCGLSIVVYSMMSGRFATLKTPIKNPEACISRDGTTILVFGTKKKGYENRGNGHYCIIDSPFV